MLSSRPYLIRALYEWIVDSDCTPYVLVDAGRENVMVPQEFVKDGQIVLNISPTAVQDLSLEQSAIAFSARFSGISRDIYVPCHAVMGIYARENGQGMIFEPEDDLPLPPSGGDDDPVRPAKSPSSGRPSLKVVK